MFLIFSNKQYPNRPLVHVFANDNTLLNKEYIYIYILVTKSNDVGRFSFSKKIQKIQKKKRNANKALFFFFLLFFI